MELSYDSHPLIYLGGDLKRVEEVSNFAESLTKVGVINVQNYFNKVVEHSSRRPPTSQSKGLII